MAIISFRSGTVSSDRFWPDHRACPNSLTSVGYRQEHTFKNLRPGVDDANSWNHYAVRADLEFYIGADTTLRLSAAHD